MVTKTSDLLFKIYGFIIYSYLLVPMLVVIVFSFNSNRFPTLPLGEFSLKWYLGMAVNETLLGAAYNSIIVGIIVAIVSTTIGIPGGYALVRCSFFGKRVLDSIKLLPIIIPPLLMGFGLLLFYASVPFIRFSYFTLIISHVIYTLPYVLLITSARLIGFNWSLEEASKDLGARNLMTFFRIILPYLWPAVSASLVLCFILSFNEIIIAIWVVGTNNTLPIYMWSQFQRYISPEINAISTVVIAIVAVFLLSVSFIGKGIRGRWMKVRV